MAIDISKLASGLNKNVASAHAGKPVTDAPAPVAARKPVELTLNPEQSEKAVREAIEKINQQMAANKQHLGFSKDESINGPVIVVTNSVTGEVIRKIPSEEVIRVAHSIDALKGVLYSTKF